MPKFSVRTPTPPCLLLILTLALTTCFQCITLCGRAQTAAVEPETVLNNKLMGQPLILRNMSAATKIHGSWDGHAASLDPPLWHTFAALTVSKIQLKGAQVKIEATRNHIVSEDKTGKLGLSSVETPVTLTLTLKGDPAALAPTLRDAIFFPGIDAALAAVPKGFQKAILPHEGAATDPLQPVCDCADTSGTCRAVSGASKPRVLSSVEPGFSKAARRKKINGSVEVGIRLDETGAIADEWLVRELGYGLDEQAAIAVSKYKFAPSTCHDTPVGTTLFIDVNFQIY
jgi:hypothetical protein